MAWLDVEAFDFYTCLYMCIALVYIYSIYIVYI